MAASKDSAGIVAPVTLRWHAGRCGECDAQVAPTPDEAHARELAAGHEHDLQVEPVELDWQLARCACGWEGNPTARKQDAAVQLAGHEPDCVSRRVADGAEQQ